MKFSMKGQRKRLSFNTGDCLIEVTAWAGLNVYIFFCIRVECSVSNSCLA